HSGVYAGDLGVRDLRDLRVAAEFGPIAADPGDLLGERDPREREMDRHEPGYERDPSTKRSGDRFSLQGLRNGFGKPKASSRNESIQAVFSRRARARSRSDVERAHRVFPSTGAAPLSTVPRTRLVFRPRPSGDTPTLLTSLQGE